MKCPFCDAKLYKETIDNNVIEKCPICFLNWSKIDNLDLDQHLNRKLIKHIDSSINELKEWQEYGPDDYDDEYYFLATV